MLIKQLLGPEAALYASMVEAAINGVGGVRYSFLDAGEYEQLALSNPSLGAKTYWEETLGRCHFAATSSLLRNHRWLKGLASAIDSKNYFTLASAMRGLIESAADAHYCLRGVSLTLAQHCSPIWNALSGHGKLLIIEGFEEKLIHYSFARRLERGESAPRTHKAETTTEYLTALAGEAVPGVIELYARLCQISHPAAPSVLIWLQPEDALGHRCSIDPQGDAVAFSELLSTILSKNFVDLLMFAFNPGLLCLRVLNDYFPIGAYKNPGVAGINFDSIPLWKKIQNAAQSK